MKTDSEVLLTRYFGGNASDEELRELESWIAESPENEAEFMKLTQVYELSGATHYLGFDVEKGKTLFLNHIKQNKSKRIKILPKSNIWYYVAACITLVVTISSITNYYYADKITQYASNNSDLSEILSDNSRIILAKNSTLSFSTNKSTKTNIATLIGSVKWAVGKNNAAKLQIRAGETIIEDIGTVFEVSALPVNNFVEVKVSEGMVHFYTLKNKGLIIRAGESGIYDKNKNLFRFLASGVTKNGVKNIQLNLEGISLVRAVNVISNAYGVDIQLKDGDYVDKLITVQFQNESLSTVLQVLSQTLQLKLEKTGNTYYLNTNGRN